MKKCPFCQAQNQDGAQVCEYCGRGLPRDAGPADPTPTQPVRIRPVQPEQTRLTPPTQPVRTAPRPPDPKDPYGQPWRQPASGVQVPLPAATEPFPPQGVEPYNSPAPYYPRPYVQPQMDYSPPAPAPAQRSGWPLLIAGLGVLLVFVCGLAFFTLTRATANGATGLRAQVSTQIGRIFGGTGDANPASVVVAPSATPVPTDLPQPTAAPQDAIAKKLLSAECRASLDQLTQVSDLVKNDPLKVLDAAWRNDLNQATADMKTHCGSLDSASPIPGEIGQVQKSINQASSEFDQANQLWNQAIDQRDPSKAIDAAQHIGAATRHLGQAISQLQKLAQ